MKKLLLVVFLTTILLAGCGPVVSVEMPTGTTGVYRLIECKDGSGYRIWRTDISKINCPSSIESFIEKMNPEVTILNITFVSDPMTSSYWLVATKKKETTP